MTEVRGAKNHSLSVEECFASGSGSFLKIRNGNVSNNDHMSTFKIKIINLPIER